MQGDALSYRVQALRLVLADLELAPGGAELRKAARALLRFYLGLAKQAGSLTGEPLVLRLPGTPRQKYQPRQRPQRQALSRHYILAALREAPGSLSTREIRDRLAAEGRKLSRQATSYQLQRLARAGTVERLNDAGVVRWRAVD